MKDNKNQESNLDKTGKPLTEKPLKTADKKDMKLHTPGPKKDHHEMDDEDGQQHEESTSEKQNSENTQHKEKSGKPTVKRGNL